jgi:hypothetical protein
LEICSAYVNCKGKKEYLLSHDIYNWEVKCHSHICCSSYGHIGWTQEAYGISLSVLSLSRNSLFSPFNLFTSWTAIVCRSKQRKGISSFPVFLKTYWELT